MSRNLKRLAMLLLIAAQWPASAAERKEIPLTLEESIRLALTENRSLKQTMLSTKASHHAVAEAYTAFEPEFSLQGNAGFDLKTGKDAVTVSKTQEEAISVASTLSFNRLFKSGKQVNLKYSGGFKDTDLTQTSGPFTVPSDSDLWSHGVSLNYQQPLLRGASKEINLTPIKIKELEEFNAKLSHQENQLTIVIQVIKSYRQMLEAREIIKIREQSLKTSKAQNKKIEMLIQAGRLAKLENVQSKADIATGELNLLQAKRNFTALQLSFLKLLDIESGFRVLPVDNLDLPKTSLPKALEEAVKEALSQRPDILQARNTVEIRKKQMSQAAYQLKKQLNLNAGVSMNSSDGDVTRFIVPEADQKQAQWNVAVQYSRDLGGYKREKEQIAQSRIFLDQASIVLQDLEAAVPLELEELLAIIEANQKALELAGQSRELSEQKLEVERSKLEFGQSSAFQLLAYKNDLANAQLQELSAKVNLANALTDYSRALGRLSTR